MTDLFAQAQDLAARAESIAEDAAKLRDLIGEQPVAADMDGPQDASKREKIGIRDANGKKLAVGDKVQVTGSSRYGTATGVVVGGEPAEVDGAKDRVVVKLDSGQNDGYAPSAERVERLEKAA